jgi:hypothetical protein
MFTPAREIERLLAAIDGHEIPPAQDHTSLESAIGMLDAATIYELPEFEKRAWHLIQPYYAINQSSRAAAKEMNLLQQCQSPLRTDAFVIQDRCPSDMDPPFFLDIREKRASVPPRIVVELYNEDEFGAWISEKHRVGRQYESEKEMEYAFIFAKTNHVYSAVMMEMMGH